MVHEYKNGEESRRKQMIFDTHAHYDDEAFDEDREALLEGLTEHGIEAVVNIGNDMLSTEHTLELTKRYPQVYGAAGVHPSSSAELDEEKFSLLRTAAMDPQIVAVGETGLDYYWDEPDRGIQKYWFGRQLELAREVRRPVVIHSRDAAKDTFDIMKEPLQSLPRGRDWRGYPLFLLWQGYGQRIPESGILPRNRRGPYVWQCKKAERGGGIRSA
jgi:Tat protein secretion system quality control protein TatD with DNase activity